LQGGNHVSITREVANAVLCDRPASVIEAIALRASFPDEVNDVFVEDVGDHIVGRALCSALHFFNGTRGYSWHLDGSVPHIDLPNRDVSCIASKWTFLSFDDRLDHPLLKVHGAADEIVYPSAYDMALWLGRCVNKRSYAALGSALHFVQDAREYHHQRCWMLRGHAQTEADLNDRWFSPAFRSYREKMVKGAAKMKRKYRPEEAVIAACKLASAGPRAMALDATLMDTVRLTAAVLRWWKDAYP